MPQIELDQIEIFHRLPEPAVPPGTTAAGIERRGGFVHPGVLVQYEGINGVTFEGCDFMDFENDQTARIRTIFDSRPLMQG